MKVHLRHVLGLTAVLSLALSAQSPLAVRSTLPSPACGNNILAVADFDSSGLPDYLVLSGTVPAPLLGVVQDPAVPGGGCVTSPMTGLSSSLYIKVLTARLNPDANIDVVISSGYQNRIIDAYGSGSGGFVFTGTGPYVVPPIAGYVSAVAVADFDSNGRDDVIVLHQTGQFGIVEAFRNLPTGWTMSWSHALTASPNIQFEAGDVDGDGTLDLLWSEYFYPPAGGAAQSRLRIARGLGNGMFAVDAGAPTVGPLDVHVRAVADLDSDGFDDVVMTMLSNSPLQSVYVAYGVPLGTPVVISTIPTLFDSLRVPTVVDFDHDGVLDIVVEGFTQPSVTHPLLMLRGLGARQFSAPITFSIETFVPFYVTQIHAVDMDGDHDVDLLRTDAPFVGTVTSIVLLDNQTIYAPGCAGSGSVIPTLSTGVATPGNAAFAIGLGSALPNSPAVLGVSLASVPVSGCGVALNLGLANLILPSGSLGLVVTDPSGAASVSLPIPEAPAVSGITVYAQWGVVDPQGALSFGGQSFSLSEAHTIYVW